MYREINIDNSDFYVFDKPEIKERTKNRLQEIIDLGLKEVGIAQFGIPEIMSGLYIENIWNFDDSRWNHYVEWIKSLIDKKHIK